MNISKIVLGFALCASLGVGAPAQMQQVAFIQAAAGQRVSKAGTVKSINDKTLVLKADAGPDITVTFADGARLLRLSPGQTNLKSAESITLSQVQVGDRILVRGTPGSAPDSLAGLSAVIMKRSDVAQKQQQELEEWRRGTGGIVKAIDAATGTITVAVAPSVNVSVNTSPATVFLRYSPDSVRFADAQKSAFNQIKIGDQLRARGTHSADGHELTAEEVISGTFRNIAGTITSINAEAGTIKVKDVLGKKSVTIKLSGDSEMRKLPPQLAQRIAFFLKSPEIAAAMAARRSSGGRAFGGGRRPPDFQQIINRLPAVTIHDLQKEDAVMIVSTPGAGGPEVTAITLLSGVEPILTASPNAGNAAALLNGWNLSAPSGDAGPQ